MLNFKIFFEFLFIFCFLYFLFVQQKCMAKKQPAKPAAVIRSLYAASFTFSSFLVSSITPSCLSSLSRYSSILSYVSYVYLTVISL